MRKIRLLTMMLILASTVSMVSSTKPVQASASIIHFSHMQWTPEVAGSGPMVHHSLVVFPASASQSGATVMLAGLLNVCTLRGDFDIRVNYKLDVWPKGNGVRVAIGDVRLVSGGFGDVQRRSDGPNDNLPPGEMYVTDFPDGLTGVPTSDLSGTLREVRSGGTVTGYYLSGSNWVAIHSSSTTTADFPFGVAAWTFDAQFGHQEVKAAFRDFVINSGTLVCP